VTKVHLHRAGLVNPAVKRSAPRKKRPRGPMIGLLLHRDGSRHAWFEGVAPLDLIVTMDAATSAIYSAFLVEEEGTALSFRGLRETKAADGLFCTDRGSHCFHTPKSGERACCDWLTQLGRALEQRRIEHNAAYSPEVRGRSEPLFRTLQDRRPKALLLAALAPLGPFAMGHSPHLPVPSVTLASNGMDWNVAEMPRKPRSENRAVFVPSKVNSGRAWDRVGPYQPLAKAMPITFAGEIVNIMLSYCKQD
jgi:hypothetical protein